MPPRGGSARKGHQSSSPHHVKESPVGRRTRSTRSTSAEPGSSSTATLQSRAASRITRQTSVKSVGSTDGSPSVTPAPGSSRRRRATPAVVASQDLLTVPEDEEDADEVEEQSDLSDPHREDHDRGSPGAESAVSGSSTYVTSHSAAEVAELDPMLAEILPELLRSSYAILDLLAPPNASEEMVVSINRELKVFGSRRAKRLKYDEERFHLTKTHYGNDWYINPVHTLRRLFGTNDPGDGDFRPDVVLHTANMATAIKDFLVISKDSRRTTEALSHLSSSFPKVFVSNFIGPDRLGGSSLFEETFDLAIEIRTQLAIAYLKELKDDVDQRLTPHVTLASVFYDAPLPSPSSETYFGDLFQSAQLRRLMEVEVVNLGDKVSKVTERILLIQSALRQSSEVADAGDLVDFDLLDEWFPWPSFLASLVKWCRLRMEEIARSIREHGGIDKITKSVVNAIKDVDSQADVYYDPPSFIMEPPSLLPAANIIPTSAGQSLYDGKSAVAVLEMLKRGISAHHPPTAASDQALASMPPPPSPAVPRHLDSGDKRASRPPKVAPHINQADVDDFRESTDDEEEDEVAPRSTAEYLVFFNDHINDKNKENHLISGQSKANPKKFRLLDRQPDAVKVAWEGLSQASAAGLATPKRPREERAATEESQDQDFQQDQRVPNPVRRAEAAVARHRTPVEDELPPPKRARAHSPLRRPSVAAGGSVNELRSRQVAGSQNKNSRPGGPNNMLEIEDDSSEDDRPRYSQINLASKQAALRVKVNRPMQRRIPWSEHDEERLISLIEDSGCSWSFLEKVGGFEHQRNQVALKDKARNMKVDYIKIGVPLPTNFELVTLGAKEKASILAVRPDYDFEE